MSCLFMSFALLSIFLARIARTQITLATCTSDYKWASNTNGESPCDVGTELVAICHGPNFTTWVLPEGTTYWGPWRGYDMPCDCSTVTWSLFSACATCQNEATIPWGLWANNCSNVTVDRFPLDTPQQVVIPHWAYLNVGGQGWWNETAAKLDTQNPPNPHHTPVGAIVGGVIGGLAALAIAVTLFVALRYRFRRVAAKRPPSTLYGSEGASPNKPENTAAQSTITPGFAADHPMHQKFYNPSDPSTFPPPLNHNHSSYTSPSESPGNYRTVVYQPSR